MILYIIMNHYHLFKEKVKLLAKKYVFGEQFIDYIDKKDFYILIMKI